MNITTETDLLEFLESKSCFNSQPLWDQNLESQ